MPDLLAGADVGGSKVIAGLADAEGRVVASRREPTAQEGGAAVVSQIIRLLGEVLREGGASPQSVAAIGIAVPAVVDRARGVVLWAPNIRGWQREVEVAGPVQQALAMPTSLHYDGHAWAAGEHWCGAGRGAADVAVIAVGTGVGGGLILGGRLHRGRIGVAGAVGWWVPDWRQAGSARPQHEGWLESLASGPAIARAAGKPSAEEAFQAARSGDEAARDAVARAAQVLGAAVANIVSLVEPEVVVLAGGVIAGGADLLLPTIREVAGREAQPQVAPTIRIVPAALGEEAGWLGAARLAWAERHNREGAL